MRKLPNPNSSDQNRLLPRCDESTRDKSGRQDPDIQFVSDRSQDEGFQILGRTWDGAEPSASGTIFLDNSARGGEAATGRTAMLTRPLKCARGGKFASNEETRKGCSNILSECDEHVCNAACRRGISSSGRAGAVLFRVKVDNTGRLEFDRRVASNPGRTGLPTGGPQQARRAR